MNSSSAENTNNCVHVPTPQTSGDDNSSIAESTTTNKRQRGDYDNKNQDRIVANRNSQRKSRARKKMLIESLESSVTALTKTNQELMVENEILKNELNLLHRILQERVERSQVQNQPMNMNSTTSITDILAAAMALQNNNGRPSLLQQNVMNHTVTPNPSEVLLLSALNGMMPSQGAHLNNSINNPTGTPNPSEVLLSALSNSMPSQGALLNTNEMPILSLLLNRDGNFQLNGSGLRDL